MHENRLRRLPDFDYKGFHQYSLTFSSFERRPLFEDHELVETVKMHFLNAAAACDFEITAYCFMPDHLHTLVKALSQTASLPKFVKRAKQMSGYHGKQVTGRRIWQTGYYERVLREAEDPRQVIAYILENLVRRGLVSSPGEYAASGSGVYTMAELLESVQLHR
jgi:REP-associated tyrosine transposase